MGMYQGKWRCSGQMTVEFMAMLPVMIVAACIAVNAGVFFSKCASFDLEAKNAVRAYAAAPGYGQGEGAAASQIAGVLEDSFNDGFSQVSVSSAQTGGGLVRYEAVLDYAPNLFGMGVRDSVLGVSLPHLTHRVALTVSPYKPGMLF